MSFRALVSSVGIAALLGLAGGALAQDKPESTPDRTGTAKESTGSDRDDAGSAKEKPGTAKEKSKASGTLRKGKAGADSEKAKGSKAKLEKATFGGGCFWCLEAVFERIPGVKSVVSGYAGGNVARPSYELVCTGLTGHAEVVQIEFDPEVVSFDKLLEVFWVCHDPTTLNRQGPDMGTQYRSIILFHNQEQQVAARKSYDKITAAHVYADPIVTELVPLRAFYPAEAHHQDFYRKHRSYPYCQMEIAPKLMKLKMLGELPDASTGASSKKAATRSDATDGDYPAPAAEKPASKKTPARRR
jgi:peptide-methionine (S)-S-oxide reductase